VKKYKGIILLFAAGLVIMAYPHIAQLVNRELQHRQAEDFRTVLDGMSDSDITELMKRARRYNEDIHEDLDGLRDPWGDQQALMVSYHETMGFGDEDAFGALEIPKLNLHTPIYLGSSEAVLSKGIGQVEGSSLPLGGTSTHTVLAGHRGMWTKTMFRHLDQLRPGDLFYVHTIDGKLTYRVTSQQVIYPDETDSLEIQEGKDLATLLTCHPYPQNYQRLLVHAERER